MTTTKNIERHFQNLNNIRNQIIIVDDSSVFDFKLLDNSLLIAFASWSGTALSNFTQTIKLINERCYKGQIVIIDIDEMTSDLQIKTFGEVSHGWAEIFVVEKGKVIERFLGASCFEKFKLKVDSLQIEI